MPSGTFVIKGAAFVNTGDAVNPIGGTIPECLAANNDGKYISFSSLGSSYTLRVNTSTAVWTLTGPGAGSYLLADLPSGMTILTAQINYGGAGVGNTNFYGGDDAFVNANANANVQGNVIDITDLNRAANQVNPPSPKVLTVTGHPLDLNNDGFGFTFNITGSSVSFELDVLTITGTYSIQDFQFDLGVDTQPLRAGSTVTITSDPTDPNYLQLNQLTEIDIVQGSNTPVTIVGTPTEFSITFLIPNLSTLPTPNPPTLFFQAVGNGTQFSGSVDLGTLETIYFVNAPGIYFIDKMALSDTLYNPDGGTIVVPIPEPFFKTGFIGG